MSSTAPTNEPPIFQLPRWLRDLWRTPARKEEPSPTEKKATVVGMPVLISILDRGEQTSDPATKTGKVLSELIAAQGRAFWETGLEDGRLGQQKPGIDETAKQYEEIVRAELLADYQGRADSSAARLTIEKTKSEKAEREYQDHKKHLDFLTSFQRTNPRAFSGALAVIYLILAVLLTFCDIPLALKLTQRGFDLDLGTLSIAEFFVHPISVVQQNWEVFVLALGIALCTIYIKIFWDDKLERPATVDAEAEVPNGPRARNAKWWKIIIFALTLFTVFILGAFRFVWLEEGGMADHGDMYGGITLSDETPQGTPTASGPAAGGTGTSWKGAITLLAFILITVLFPVVGGICASLGMNCAQNRRELKSSQTAYAKAEEEYHDAVKSHEQAIHEDANWRSSLEKYKDAEWAGRIKNLLISYYQHGYQRGYLEGPDSDSERDLFSRTEEFRGKMVAHRVQDVIQRNLQPVSAGGG